MERRIRRHSASAIPAVLTPWTSTVRSGYDAGNRIITTHETFMGDEWQGIAANAWFPGLGRTLHGDIGHRQLHGNLAHGP